MSRNYFFASRREGGFSHEEKKGDAKGKAGKDEAGSAGMGAGTANPTFFPDLISQLKGSSEEQIALIINTITTFK